MARSEPHWPPKDGTVTVSEVLDFNMQYNANFPMFRFLAAPESNEILEISMLELGRASHRVAHTVRPVDSSKFANSKSEVVAIIATLDNVHYHAITMGLIKAGLVPFPMSPRNSAAGIVSMLRATNCHRILATRSTVYALLDSIKIELQQAQPDAGIDGKTFELSIEEPPRFDICYPHLGRESIEDAFTPYPRLPKPDMDSIAFYIHSSGSTGHPKPIAEIHRIVIIWCNLPWVQDQLELHPSLRLATMATPPFHIMGTMVDLIFPLFTLRGVNMLTPVCGLGFSEMPIVPTSDVILEHARKIGTNAILTIPSFIEAWAESPDTVEYLKSMVYVGFGGGPLPYEKGQALAKASVKIRPAYGGTEIGPIAYSHLSDDLENADWNYVKFSEWVDIHWVPQGNGTFELTIRSSEKYDVAVDNMGLKGVRGYTTSDVWAPHPTKPDRFKIVGRADDVITLALGEKVVPKPIEDALASSPLIKTAIVFGRERHQAGILVMPRQEVFVETDPQRKTFVSHIWPVIEKINEDIPAFSRIFRFMVLVTAPGKPVLFTEKGTVKKKATIQAYEQEINTLYERIEKGANQETDSQFQPPPEWTKSGLLSWLRMQTKDLISVDFLDKDKDLFANGLDSLSLTFLRNRIIWALQSQLIVKEIPMPEVPVNFIYYNPTLKHLATFMIDALEGKTTKPESVQDNVASWAHIEQAVEQYSVGLGQLSLESQKSKSEVLAPAVVLLTGSTGSLGSYLLSTFVRDDRVDRIYCLNRLSNFKASLRQRQKKTFEELGLDMGVLASPKVVLLEGDLSQDKFGLVDEIYAQIHSSVTVIIHNAWRLDFNLALSSFEPLLDGTHKLVKAALTMTKAEHLRFFFMSSISAVQSWPLSHGKVPENSKIESKYAVGMGYGESKYVAERIIGESGLYATSFRIGQIVHPSWAMSDWFPILIKSGIQIGSLPTMTGLVTWIPAQTVSNAIIDDMFVQQHYRSETLHLVHPKPILWNEVIELVCTIINEQRPERRLVLVSAPEWLKELEELGQNEEMIRTSPAIKLLDFFSQMFNSQVTDAEEVGGVPGFTCDMMQQISPSLERLQPLNKDDVKAWVLHWASRGL